MMSQMETTEIWINTFNQGSIYNALIVRRPRSELALNTFYPAEDYHLSNYFANKIQVNHIFLLLPKRQRFLRAKYCLL